MVWLCRPVLHASVLYGHKPCFSSAFVCLNPLIRVLQSACSLGVFYPHYLAKHIHSKEGRIGLSLYFFDADIPLISKHPHGFRCEGIPDNKCVGASLVCGVSLEEMASFIPLQIFCGAAILVVR